MLSAVRFTAVCSAGLSSVTSVAGQAGNARVCRGLCARWVVMYLSRYCTLRQLSDFFVISNILRLPLRRVSHFAEETEKHVGDMRKYFREVRDRQRVLQAFGAGYAAALRSVRRRFRKPPSYLKTLEWNQPAFSCHCQGHSHISAGGRERLET